MSVIDVTNHDEKKPGFFDNLSTSWDQGLNRFFWDHVKRGLQLGSVFGTAVVLPFTIFNDLRKLRALSIRRILFKQAASLTLGMFLSLGWMMVRYWSWSNKQQKLHNQTYYMPGEVQSQFDYVTTFWGGGAFLLVFLVTRKFVVSFGAMSPVIAVGMFQSQVRRLSQAS